MHLWPELPNFFTVCMNTQFLQGWHGTVSQLDASLSLTVGLLLNKTSDLKFWGPFQLYIHSGAFSDSSEKRHVKKNRKNADDSVSCRITLINNCNCIILSPSHIIVEELGPSFLYNIASLHHNIHLFTTLLRSHQCFNQGEIWTLTGPLFGSFALLFWIIVLLYYLIGQRAPHLTLEYFGKWKSSWSSWCLQGAQVHGHKTSPNYHVSTT